MNIILNHNSETFDYDKMTIADIMKEKKFVYHDLIIRVNGTLIKHERYDEVEVKEGDNVEIIHIFHGG